MTDQITIELLANMDKGIELLTKMKTCSTSLVPSLPNETKLTIPHKTIQKISKDLTVLIEGAKDIRTQIFKNKRVGNNL